MLNLVTVIKEYSYMWVRKLQMYYKQRWNEGKDNCVVYTLSR